MLNSGIFDIPPPRPKRKPSRPYPKKDFDLGSGSGNEFGNVCENFLQGGPAFTSSLPQDQLQLQEYPRPHHQQLQRSAAPPMMLTRAMMPSPQQQLQHTGGAVLGIDVGPGSMGPELDGAAPLLCNVVDEVSEEVVAAVAAAASAAAAAAAAAVVAAAGLHVQAYLQV